jgi:hypothetical protein
MVMIWYARSVKETSLLIEKLAWIQARVSETRVAVYMTKTRHQCECRHDWIVG